VGSGSAILSGEQARQRRRSWWVSAFAPFGAAVLAVGLMSLADGATQKLSRPVRVVHFGAGAPVNHQGLGNALTPENLAPPQPKRTPSPTTTVAPPTPVTELAVATRPAQTEVADVAAAVPSTTTTTTPAAPSEPTDRFDGFTALDVEREHAHLFQHGHRSQLKRVKHAAHTKRAKHKKPAEHRKHKQDRKHGGQNRQYFSRVRLQVFDALVLDQMAVRPSRSNVPRWHLSMRSSCRPRCH